MFLCLHVCVSVFVPVRVSISRCVDVCVVCGFYFACICLVSFLEIFQKNDKGNPLLLSPKKSLQKGRKFAGHSLF